MVVMVWLKELMRVMPLVVKRTCPRNERASLVSTSPLRARRSRGERKSTRSCTTAQHRNNWRSNFDLIRGYSGMWVHGVQAYRNLAFSGVYELPFNGALPLPQPAMRGAL